MPGSVDQTSLRSLWSQCALEYDYTRRLTYSYGEEKRTKGDGVRRVSYLAPKSMLTWKPNTAIESLPRAYRLLNASAGYLGYWKLNGGRKGNKM